MGSVAADSWLCFLTLAGLLMIAAQPVGAGPCAAFHSSLLVHTDSHLLYVCQDRKTVQAYEVALGQGGIDKSVEGDAKTPLGEYMLGRPAPSPQFGIFIPIGYPTAAQRARGFTGSDIGVHGPLRQFKHLGRVNTATDWTLGCIAVGSDREIAEISRWVKIRKGARIIIRRSHGA